MTAPSISITVAGTPTSGWQESIYQWGDCPVALKYEYETDGGVQTSERYFILRVEEDRTVYIAKSQCVNAHSGGRGGQLVVALAVPKGYGLASQTPCQALTRLFDTFVSRCMTGRKDMYGQAYWEYNAQIPKQVLDDVARELRLAAVRRPHRAMNPDPQGKSVLLIVPEAKLETFFADPMYPELASYRQAIIKADGPREQLLPGMTIPRTVRWKVKVADNGEPCTIQVNGVGKQPVGGCVEVSDPMARVRCAGNRPREYYTNDEKTFTIGGEQGVREVPKANVLVDEVDETITVKLAQATAQTKRYYITFEDKDAARAFRSRPFFRLTLDHCKPLSVSHGKDDGLYFDLTGEDIGQRQTIGTEANSQDSDYKVEHVHWAGEKLYIKTRRVVKTPPPTALVPANPRGKARGQEDTCETSTSSAGPCLTIELPEDAFRGIKDIESESQRVVIKENRDGTDYLEMRLFTLFRPHGEAYATEIPLGKDWVRDSQFVNVEVHLENHRILKTSEAKAISAQGARLTGDDFEPSSTASLILRVLRKWGGYVILALLCFAAGGICQYRFGWGGDPEGVTVTDTLPGDADSPAPVETPDPAPAQEDESTAEDPFKQRMSEARVCLAKEALTFAEVRALHDSIYTSVDSTQYQAADGTTFQAIKDYYDIQKWINEGKHLDDLGKIAEGLEPSYINECHLKMLRNIYHTSNGNRVYNQGYSGHYNVGKGFSSFLELNDIVQDTVSPTTSSGVESR